MCPQCNGFPQKWWLPFARAPHITVFPLASSHEEEFRYCLYSIHAIRVRLLSSMDDKDRGTEEQRDSCPREMSAAISRRPPTQEIY